MVPKKDLLKIHLLKDMPGSMLDQIAKIAQLRIFSAETILFKQNEKLNEFYMLLSGQISLYVDISPEVTVILGTVRPGYICGLSTFIPDALTSSMAHCDESSELISLPRLEMEQLFVQDQDLAFNFMFRLVRILKSINDYRTSIYIKALERHPQIQKDLANPSDLGLFF